MTRQSDSRWSIAMTNAAVKKHRLHALCPYFAMFPEYFARESILEFTRPGELVLDPFSGRGTTILEALLNDRDAIGCDISPVAYCVSAAKAGTPSLPRILQEATELERAYKVFRSSPSLEREQSELPEFFKVAFDPRTLHQLLFVRSMLKWKELPTDRFIAALILRHLHGESQRSPNYLSNQMPHTISTKPAYSIRYWKKRKLKAPERNVFEMIRHRARYRFEDGKPARKGKMFLCDVRRSGDRLKSVRGCVNAVVTSPPYLNVTDFQEDQWLRL
jgi:hypothetical protein